MILYGDIIKEVSIRCDTVKGMTAADKEANLAVNPLTATQIGSTDFPFSTVTRSVLSGVARIVRTYAGVKNHPFRNYNLSQTATIAHKGQIPFVNSTSKPIVGVYGAIKDAVTGEVLTEQPKQIIESLIRSKADTSIKQSYLYYAIIDGVMYHTTANVKIDVVTFDLAAEKTAIVASSGLSPLPDACFDLAWASALTLMMIDDDFTGQARVFADYVNGELANMANGGTSFSSPPEMSIAATPSVS